MKDIIKKWQDQLLDLGKKNRLINFADSESATLDIISPTIDVVYKRFCGGNKLEFYDIESIFKARIKEINDTNKTVAKTSKKSQMAVAIAEDAEIEQKPSITQKEVQLILANAKANLKQKQVLGYKSPVGTQKALQYIKKYHKNSLTEKGINPLYLSFGMLEWTDKAENKLLSPLILVPAKIESEALGDLYTIKLYEDEIIFNPTLKYKLKMDYDIDLPNIEQDEDILAYLARINQLVTKSKWKVKQEIKLSSFSFLKMNIYNDIKDNEERMLNNPNIRMLMGENIEIDFSQVSNEKKEEYLNNNLLHNVVDADSSQIEAIIQAKEGKSFILQGPPGTGKSQTITNIIAEFLSEDKKVLFVSEKLAALNVVYDNLSKVGLEEYCLPIHSHNANKKNFVTELYKTLTAPRPQIVEDVKLKLDKLAQASHTLNNYAKALNAKNKIIDLSTYELYNKYFDVKTAPDCYYEIKDFARKNLTDLAFSVDLLKQYVDYTEDIGKDYTNNIWYGLDANNPEYKNTFLLSSSLNETIKAIEEYHNINSELYVNLSIDVKTIQDMSSYAEVFKNLAEVNLFSSILLDNNLFSDFKDSVCKLSSIMLDLTSLRDEITKKYTDIVYDITNIQSIYDRYINKYKSFFGRLSKDYKKDSADLSDCLQSKKKLNFKEFSYDIELLHKRLTLTAKYYELANGVSKVLGTLYLGVKTDWNAILADIDKFAIINAKKLDLGNIKNLSKQNFILAKQKFNDLYKEISRINNQYYNPINFTKNLFDLRLFNLTNSDLILADEKIKHCLANVGKIEHFMRFLKLLNVLSKNDLADFALKTIKDKIAPGDVVASYKKQFFKLWVDYVTYKNPTLREFSRVTQDILVNDFKNLDDLSFVISRAKIREKLSNMRPSLTTVIGGSPVATLMHEAEKQRRIMPVRVLFEKIPDLILSLKPCLLMSPLSVSTYLDPRLMDFDLVIFDEASQIFPEDALGAIYRAKQVIIVGDSKQMPPNSAFLATGVESDDYTEDPTDYESILDIGSVKMPQTRLKWHYRSRAEELINFSNNKFYNNQLITFPSRFKSNDNYGVYFNFVENGVYNRKKRVNNIEAKEVANLVFELVKTDTKFSIGVVAFSKSQQEEIEEELLVLRKKSPTFEKYFAESNKDSFFIKNLETVQGDERDIIIFSIGYAKDSDGKFINNFGPLNTQGGERRLNVAITRAKNKLIVVSSIHHYDISNKISSNGAVMLKDYLQYAEEGGKTYGGAINLNKDLVAEDVINFLKSHNYNVTHNLGVSENTIDIAIMDKDNQNYVMAIELDGLKYSLSNITRDRDRLRQSVLENAGWNYYRIWSTDWLKNIDIEKEKLLNAVKNAFGDTFEKTQTLVGQDKIQIEETIPDTLTSKEMKKMYFTEYNSFDDIDSIINSNSMLRENFLTAVKKITTLESPINREWLIKRLSPIFQKNKVTDTLRKNFDHFMRFVPYLDLENGFYYLSKEEKYLKLRLPKENAIPRDIEHICDEEIKHGLTVFLEKNLGIEKEGLYKTLSELMGYARISPKITKRLDAVLLTMTKNKEIKQDGNKLFLQEISE